VCTVTWVRRRGGFVLGANRDELRTRSRAHPPRLHEREGTRWVAPVDSDAGGSWVTANEHGLALALLNGWFASRGPAPDAWRSRGLLVDDLAPLATAGDVASALAGLDLSVYRPFTLAALDPGAPTLVASWDGAEFLVEARADGHAPLCSSSLDAERATRTRTELWRAGGGVADAEAQGAFHASHAEGPGPWSVCMHREDAATVSFTRIEVAAGSVELRYGDGPPCRAELGAPHVLERTAAAAGR
jgi:hypothetical protein